MTATAPRLCLVCNGRPHPPCPACRNKGVQPRLVLIEHPSETGRLHHHVTERIAVRIEEALGWARVPALSSHAAALAGLLSSRRYVRRTPRAEVHAAIAARVGAANVGATWRAYVAALEEWAATMRDEARRSDGAERGRFERIARELETLAERMGGE